MIRFNNDYNHGAHPKILEALTVINNDRFGGYGEDEWCKKAADLIRKKVNCPDAAVHFFPGATQANFIVIASALSSVQSVIAADTGHINCHEAASVENTNHKIQTLPNKDGKITAAQIDACARSYYEENEPEYYTEPKMVYISFPTEQGTLYSLEELKAIRKVCDKYGMYLFVDGARLGYGLGAAENDILVEDFAALTDVFYFGGTKCGALFGEAVVITSDNLKRRFKAYMKQNGAVLAKGWLLGLQFYTLLENDLYFEITTESRYAGYEDPGCFCKKRDSFLGGESYESAVCDSLPSAAGYPWTKIIHLKKPEIHRTELLQDFVQVGLLQKRKSRS